MIMNAFSFKFLQWEHSNREHSIFFLPLFDDYPIRALQIDKRIRIFEALPNHNIGGKIQL